MWSRDQARSTTTARVSSVPVHLHELVLWFDQSNRGHSSDLVVRFLPSCHRRSVISHFVLVCSDWRFPPPTTVRRRGTAVASLFAGISFASPLLLVEEVRYAKVSVS
ncbi:hypothetical protein Rs2_50481 [Raphanus sativus]|nr:hypothetical protein Rs2_50481 [Raphanus sativus]